MTQSAPSPAPPSDADLLAAFDKQHSQAAFTELVRRHGALVLAVCRSVLGNSADAEDAAQAVFLTLAQKRSLRRPSLAGWLHRVAWYVAARAAEARSVRQQHEQEAAAMTPKDTSPTSPADFPVHPEVLHAALAALPEKYRLPLLLCHLEDRSQKETAALLGCSIGAVAMRLNRGRQMLRERLARRAEQPVAAACVLASLAPVRLALPQTFVTHIAQAATLAATQQLAGTSLVSVTVMALSKGASNMLFWSKFKLVAAIFAVILLLGGGVGTFVAFGQTSTPATQIAGGGLITALTDTSVTITRGDKPITVSVNASTVVKIDGKAGALTDLKTGLYAGAWGTGTTASEIRAYTPKPPATQPAPQPAQIAGGGLITALTDTSVTITRGDKPTTVTIDGQTAIKIDGVIKTAADLKTGLYAMALGANGKATEIRAYTPKK